MKIHALNQHYSTNTINRTEATTNTSSPLKPQSFGMSLETGFEMSKKLKTSLYIQKFLAKIVGQENNVKYYDLGLLEGLQEGIDVFKGLKLKQIAFVGEDLHSIMTKRGCYSHCVYCYPDAQKPIKQTQNAINSVLFEDLNKLADGFKTLRKRSGINFIHNNSTEPYQSIVFDADNIEVAVLDRLGNNHEFPEVNKLIFNAIGKKGIFDTSGWNVKSEKYQKRAERIVEYYSKPENMKELHQFNISINPFHSTLVKVNELRANGNTEAADRIYDKHAEKLANALFTCIPLCHCEEFSTIKRAFNWSVPNMQGYYFTDELDLLHNIFRKLSKMCKKDFTTEQKYIKSKAQLNEVLSKFAEKLDQHGEVINISEVRIDTKLIGAPKLEQLVKSRNPDMGDYEFFKLFKDALRSDDRFSRMYENKKYRSAFLQYLKMIDANGKVYITDCYKVIPTDIQLNFINKDKETQPFATMVKDFVLTEKMI